MRNLCPLIKVYNRSSKLTFNLKKYQYKEVLLILIKSVQGLQTHLAYQVHRRRKVDQIA